MIGDGNLHVLLCRSPAGCSGGLLRTFESKFTTLSIRLAISCVLNESKFGAERAEVLIAFSAALLDLCT